MLESMGLGLYHNFLLRIDSNNEVQYPNAKTSYKQGTKQHANQSGVDGMARDAIGAFCPQLMPLF
jgi:hypothetical protein